MEKEEEKQNNNLQEPTAANTNENTQHVFYQNKKIEPLLDKYQEWGDTCISILG
jgi:hypothetical protein